MATVCIALAAALAVTAFTWRLIDGITQGELEPAPEDQVAPPRVAVETDEPFNVLVLGTDAGLIPGGRRGATRSDTMMLMSHDPLTGDVSVLSIPRDTRITVDVDRLDDQLRKRIRENPMKIAHAHAYGGAALAMAATEALLDVPVHRYVRVDLEASAKIMDLLGGVEVCVPKDMHYEDPYQNLAIHFNKGCQHLDGARALDYARYRQDSDLARIDRQQGLIRAIVERALAINVLPRLPQLVNEIAAHVDTNLTERELLTMVRLAGSWLGDYDPESLSMGAVPGRDQRVKGVYYFVNDLPGTRRLVDRLIWRLPEPEAGATQVLVKNGSGEPEIAEQLATSLADRGFAVIGTEPVEPQAQTTVLIAMEDELKGKVIARAIRNHIKTAQVFRDVNVDVGADLAPVTVIIGQDLKSVAQRY